VIQRAYSVNPDLINLNNGGVSPAPIVVQEAVERYNQLSNEGPVVLHVAVPHQGARSRWRRSWPTWRARQPGEICHPKPQLH